MNPILMEQLASKFAGANQDPLMGALFSSLMQEQNGEEQDDSRDRREEAVAAKLKARMRRLRADYEAANEMLRAISDVFGACELCWGENLSCPRCRGEGQPGRAIPIQEDLLRWVEPALNRLGLCVARQPQRPAKRAGSFQSREENTNNVR